MAASVGASSAHNHFPKLLTTRGESPSKKAARALLRATLINGCRFGFCRHIQIGEGRKSFVAAKRKHIALERRWSLSWTIRYACPSSRRCIRESKSAPARKRPAGAGRLVVLLSEARCRKAPVPCGPPRRRRACCQRRTISNRPFARRRYGRTG